MFAALLAGAILVSTDVEAKPHALGKSMVTWTEVQVRDGNDSARLEALLKNILKDESRKVDWGKKLLDPLDATISVKDFKTEVHGDVVRVSCSATGKIKGLGVAKSRFSYGGHPHEKAKLEKHVLELVSRGIVTRLAEMVRERAGEAAGSKAVAVKPRTASKSKLPTNLKPVHKSQQSSANDSKNSNQDTKAAPNGKSEK